MVKEITVANLKISAVTTLEFISTIKEALKQDRKYFVTTPNSEFLYASLTSTSNRDLLNKADIAIADGIGIFWAERLLSQTTYFRNRFLKYIEVGIRACVAGARILITPQYLFQVLPEKITGSNIIYDLAGLAKEQGASLYLLGNWGDSAKKAAEKLQQLNPGLHIAGYSNKTYQDPTVLEDIKAAHPDILFVGFGPIKQEQWIVENLPSLPVKIAMGVGGSFDYASGNKIVPPKIMRDLGLEWLFRLVTQFRFRRVFTAVIGLMVETIKFKVNSDN
jgi:N-acetylglucosaminyldiphosphoundecaprenol N-acetyl-beta-D-mannosaminyltransferase